MIRTYTLSMAFVVITFAAFSQSKTTRNFAQPIVTDSTSTMMIPTVYDAALLSSSKLSLWGNYYSNIIFYNFKTDSTKKLFEQDTYIMSLDKPYYTSYYSPQKQLKGLSSNWIFYRVMNYDRNKNEKIDNDDPMILYVSDHYGNKLKPLTPKEENVADIHLYEKQNIAMLKMQRDSNNDGNFTSKDTDYYYIKLDLSNLTFGKKIELK